jgi:hypothetical protein
MGEALTRQDGPERRRHPRRSARQRRVFLEDARGNGHYLRATWRPDTRVIVVSTWLDDVCTGAVRVPVEASAELAGLILEGLADAAALPPAPSPSPPSRVAEGWDALRREARGWARRITRRPGTPTTRR